MQKTDDEYVYYIIVGPCQVFPRLQHLAFHL